MLLMAEHTARCWVRLGRTGFWWENGSPVRPISGMQVVRRIFDVCCKSCLASLLAAVEKQGASLLLPSSIRPCHVSGHVSGRVKYLVLLLVRSLGWLGPHVTYS